MTTTHDADLPAQLDDLLARLSVAGVQHAVLLSADGLLQGRSAQTGQEVGERLAAACAGIHALATSATAPHGPRAVGALVDFHDGGLLITRSAGESLRLGVLTDASADPATIAELMEHLTARFQPALSGLAPAPQER